MEWWLLPGGEEVHVQLQETELCPVSEYLNVYHWLEMLHVILSKAFKVVKQNENNVQSLLLASSEIFVGSIVSVWRAKRLEIKLYLCSNQPNSDKWKLPRDNIVFSIKIFEIHSQTEKHLMLL